MIVNSGTLKTLFVGNKANFQLGLGQLEPQYMQIATVVPSSTREEQYGWLGKSPNMREWIGDRVIESIKAHDYTIRNKDFELTQAVERNDIRDDNLGLYGPLFQQMGWAVAAHPNQLVFGLLKAGFATNCYDGQYFFDTDHPVLDAAGVAQSVANTDGGAGEPWFLFDSSRPLKPLIFQERQKPDFVAKDDMDDDNVFMRKQFLYGIDARYNAGFGFWQYIWGSRQPLTAANYAIGRAALLGMKGDYGRPLGVMPDKLLTGPANEGAARKILNNELGAGGETNEWKGTAQVMVSPWLV